MRNVDGSQIISAAQCNMAHHLGGKAPLVAIERPHDVVVRGLIHPLEFRKKLVPAGIGLP